MSTTVPENQGTTGQTGSNNDQQGQPQPTGFDALPDETKAEIRRLRQENAGYRTKAKELETKLSQVPDLNDPDTVVGLITKALGGSGKKKDPDADRQAAEQAAKDAEAADQVRLAKVEVAVLRSAQRLGANGEAVLDSRTFLDKVADLDPADPKFQSEVEKAVQEAVESNELLKANPPVQVRTPGKSGGDLSGTNGQGEKRYTSPTARMADAYARSSGT